MQKTVLIAGGNSGIGLATTKLLANSGMSVICATRSVDQLEGLENVTTIPFDATSEDAPAAGVEVLDGFIYCPGTINLKPFHRLTDEEFFNDFQVNFMGAVRLLRANLNALKKSDHASLVFFSTVAVQTGMSFHCSVAAAKGAVEGFTRSLAAELAPKIRVNCIAPSLTDTPLASGLLNSPEKLEASSQRHPLKRVGDPGEVAKAVKFLIDDDAGFMTGQVIRIDGGLSSLRIL